MTTIKDLGLIAGVIRSATAITNKEILWRDTTANQLKYYDNVLASWVPLPSGTFHAVATSGNYNDLSNKPTLHAVASNGNFTSLNGGTLAQVLAKGFVTGANDISIDDNQVIKSTNGPSFINQRSGGTNGLTSLSDIAYINQATERVGIGIVPTTHKLELRGDGTESVLRIGTNARPFFFEMDADGRSKFWTNGNEGGLVVGGNALGFDRLNNAVLSVRGNFSTTGAVSFGNSSIIGNTINTPNGWRYSAGVSYFTDDVANNQTYIQTRANVLIHRDSTNTVDMERIEAGGQRTLKNYNTRSATVSQQAVPVRQEESTSYWDGASSQDVVYVREFSAATNGDSSVVHNVGGQDVVTLHSSGVSQYPEFTVATLPASVVGGMIIVTDEIGGRTTATGDGVGWFRTSDGDPVV